MPSPPLQLDGSNVLFWTESRLGRFHTIPYGADPADIGVISVAAMAICRYPDVGPYYLFKCDRNWEVVSDWDAESIEKAQEIASRHAIDEVIEWYAAV
ncbi:hypothetical protein [Paludisphaera borealis]|uniref:Uncharacterized protein n=1 Tax=Paludisphaera borealis TaxID=1387353 RepID=A0A1U7CQ97_9BACT|nr:hypothetical protein [Paludisphaera borealis]APW61079.1 hypothetical protein BSF38_02583 [Paludisphaera borealis]